MSRDTATIKWQLLCLFSLHSQFSCCQMMLKAGTETGCDLTHTYTKQICDWLNYAAKDPFVRKQIHSKLEKRCPIFEFINMNICSPSAVILCNFPSTLILLQMIILQCFFTRSRFLTVWCTNKQASCII